MGHAIYKDQTEWVMLYVSTRPDWGGSCYMKGPDQTGVDHVICKDQTRLGWIMLYVRTRPDGGGSCDM